MLLVHVSCLICAFNPDLPLISELQAAGCNLQVDGMSHVVHSEEESMGTRLMIDSLTCLLANETDPSRILAMSPGKLTKCVVEDGAHVVLDQPFAEIEVGISGHSTTFAACALAPAVATYVLQLKSLHAGAHQGDTGLTDDFWL